MTTIITYGTFDLFHVGHLRLLKRLRSLGDRLIVGCSTDEFNSSKGKTSTIPFSQRVEILEAVKYVDKVIPENAWEQKRSDIEREKVDIFAMGDDWFGKFDHLSDLCNVVYLTRTENISSTEIREIVRSVHAEHLKNITAAAQNLMDVVSGLKMNASETRSTK